MTHYTPPVSDLNLLFQDGGLGETLCSLPGMEDHQPDDLITILEEAGKLAAEVIAPTSRSGDLEKARLENGKVRLPENFYPAYQAYQEGGWAGLAVEPDYGGHGLPWTLAAAVQEMIQSAGMAWALNPLLTQGVIEALIEHGNEEQKTRYLPKLVSSEWSGTMNLTEPQAGSDLSKVATRAVPDGDHYRLHGQKIYITFGDHDAHKNIIHLVLARIEGAPAGTAGISLFLVPKYMVGADGSLQEHNDLRCLALEDKLGIHGSPTCVMEYGGNQGAIGFLVGKENHGLAHMFTMMNMARLFVGIQGLSIAERAFQQARTYAWERHQGRHGDEKNVPIAKHGDVRRMLLTMRAKIEAMRALLLDVMLAFDTLKRDKNPELSAYAGRRVDLMVPVVKAWFTDEGVEIASSAVQVHGGAGFVEGTGIAQLYRDARILPIYEGTNGIQAMDLVGRKILKDNGAAAREYLAEVNALVAKLDGIEGEDIAVLKDHLSTASKILADGIDHLLKDGADGLVANGLTAVYFLKLLSLVSGGVSLANVSVRLLEKTGFKVEKLSEAAQDKLRIARIYAETELVQVAALKSMIGADGLSQFQVERI